MIPVGRRKNAAGYMIAVVFLTCYLAQTIDCFGLRKTERPGRREGGDAAKTIALRDGEIVFGRASENGSGIESRVPGGIKKSSNTSAGDQASYQADHPGWTQGQTHDATPNQASWKRMAPSLQCGGDQMKFRAVGPGASQFSVEPGNAPPVPLSQVPSTCGYNMQRNSLGLVMLVPYDGCHIVQEGGSYTLPMRWQGMPVSLLCPKPETPGPTTAALPQAPSLAPMHPELYPQVPQNYVMPRSGKATHDSKGSHLFQHQKGYPLYPMQPTMATTTTKKPEVHKPKNNYYHYFSRFFPTPPPVITTTPTTTSTYPFFTFPVYPYPPWFYPGPQPTTTKPTTAKPTTKPPSQSFSFPFQYPFPFLPPMFPYPQFTTPKPDTTTKPTTTTKMTTHTHPHGHYWPFPFPPFTPPTPDTTTKPTTTTKMTTHTHPHGHYWPFPFMNYPVTVHSH